MFDFYHLTAAWADRHLSLAKAGRGSFYEHQLQTAQGHSCLYWTTGLPCPHPVYFGRPCTIGKMTWDKFPDLEMVFTLAEELNADGQRLVLLQVKHLPERRTAMRLSFYLRDIDQHGVIEAQPLWHETERLMAQQQLAEAVFSYLFHIMNLVIQVPYEQVCLEG